MKMLKRIFYFLGSIYLAILLIGTTALFVVAGTVLEAITESHRYAAYFTYQNPFFILLLWGFFVNILVSALRRWPFQSKHVPFLITHLGLLMLLSGALLKSYFGVQGSMSILEGSGSDKIFVPDSYVFHVEKRNPKNPREILADNYPLSRNAFGKLIPDIQTSPLFPELTLRLVEYAPHSHEKLETWIKGNKGSILGFPAFKITTDQNVPLSATLPLHHDEMWDIYAIKDVKDTSLAEKIYLKGLKVILTDTKTKKVLFEGDLETKTHSIKIGETEVQIVLNWEDRSQPYLDVAIHSQTYDESYRVPLTGNDSLNMYSTKPYQGKPSITLDLVRTPSLAILQDLYENTYLFAFDAFGRIHFEEFPHQILHSYISYDQGFGGYSVHAKIPFAPCRAECEQKAIHRVVEQLKHNSQMPLAPPLELIKNADPEHFTTHFVEFLTLWNDSHSWLFPLDQSLSPSFTKCLQDLDWSKISEQELKACYWIHQLALDLKDQEILPFLKNRKWPLISQLEKLDTDEDVLTALIQQIFSASFLLPDVDIDPALYPRLLSVYLLAYEIHFRNILSPVEPEHFVIESSISHFRENAIPSKKLENNLPKVVLQVSNRVQEQWITLSYDRYGQGLKEPMLFGEYLIRFQPAFQSIPYQVRLRNARQINYANAAQPYSYESDLLITDKDDKSVVEKTISMNNVHETREGYRFYLSNISPSDETAVKRIQIAVNYDPGKYWLTYFGAVVMTLGIIMLFWKKK